MGSLIVGGAGYIGSHVIASLRAAGERTIAVDDLSAGLRPRVSDDTPLFVWDVAESGAADRLSSLIGAESVDTVYLFAALKRVDESVSDPLRYYDVNVEGLRQVLDACVRGGCSNVVFSSSAAVYGDTDRPVVDENAPLEPINPYGRSKLAGEWLVRDVAQAAGIHAAILRYFNVAGTASAALADRAGTNLIPRVLERIARGEPPRIFGRDYPTPDGTCVRDFIHVGDLAEAHVHVGSWLRSTSESTIVLNVGMGRGISVLDVVSRARELTGHSELGPEFLPRRPGDPASVVADATRLGELGWRPRYGLDDMISSTWNALTA